MTILDLFSGCLLVFAAMSRMDFVSAQDIEADIDELRKLVKPVGVHARVVGGEVTTNEKLGGYLMALRYDGRYTCGGALIHDFIVLTAAHCLEGRRRLHSWVVVGGASTLNDTGVRRKVRAMVLPHTYDTTTLHLDVALLMLQKAMKGANINLISLCSARLKVGTMLTVAGWGMTDDSQMGPQNLLRVVDVPVIDKKTCKASYRPVVELTDSMFCAGILGKKDACIFDSGSPIVHNMEVCGIVSFGIGCASPRYPGVYTDVNYVMPFIAKSMETLFGKKNTKNATKN